MNGRESDKCTFCPDTIDHIEHFFCKCPIIVNFWKSVQQKLDSEMGLRVELSLQTILFGLQNCTFARLKVNYINRNILVAKMCVSIFMKIETVNSLHIINEKDTQLSNITIS